MSFISLLLLSKLPRFLYSHIQKSICSICFLAGQSERFQIAKLSFFPVAMRAGVRSVYDVREKKRKAGNTSKMMERRARFIKTTEVGVLKIPMEVVHIMGLTAVGE